MGVTTPDAGVDAMLDELLRLCLPVLSYRVCYCYCDLKQCGTVSNFGAFSTASRDLARSLCGCERALILAATVGLELDRLLARTAATSPARALCLQAIGAERIEALCDTFCKHASLELSRDGRRLRPRFSPGYGDLSLDTQRALFTLLDPARHIGLTLTEQLLMSPTKSVTAIAGIEVIP
jgi:hypothetical protein